MKSDKLTETLTNSEDWICFFIILWAVFTFLYFQHPPETLTEVVTGNEWFAGLMSSLIVLLAIYKGPKLIKSMNPEMKKGERGTFGLSKWWCRRIGAILMAIGLLLLFTDFTWLVSNTHISSKTIGAIIATSGLGILGTNTSTIDL